MKEDTDAGKDIESVYLNILEDMEQRSKDLEDARRAQLNIMEDLERRRQMVEAREKQLRDTQAMLIQAGKMTAMGQLGAGIAHELNQPLAAIRGYAQLLLEEMNPNDPRRKDVQLIEEQTGRMTKIVNNIRGFARVQDMRADLVDIHKPIEAALMLLTTQLRCHNIEVVTQFEPDLPKVQGDSNHLQQVFINLISNSRDELEKTGGGKIVIAAEAKQDANSKRYIELIVRDDGPGIPAEAMTRIFDPFFTTKEPGKGTGLGLSISYGIIRDHGGEITVSNASAGGAEFKITLPIGMLSQEAA